jgi:YD repeat-containing protein
VPQIAQLTAVPNRTPAIGEEFTYLSSGMFEYSKTDLSLPGPMPINVTRVYRSSDKTSGNFNNRAFGLGTRLSYDMFLINVGSTETDVHMPDSSVLVCKGQSHPFSCNYAPSGVWFNAYIDSTSDLVRQDGTQYHFDSSGLLVSIKDHYDNEITITRGPASENSACHGTIGGGGSVPSEYVASVSSSNGRTVYFCYDDSNNPYDITGIADNANPTIKKVLYTYDNSSRLKTVTQAAFNAEAITTYDYNQTSSGVGQLTEIAVNDSCAGSNCSNPNQVYTYITYKTNDLGDALGSISSQLPGNGYQYTYTFNSGGTYVTKVGVSLPDNSERQLHFDAAGYVTEDDRNPSESGVNEEITVFTRGTQTVGNSTEFVGEVQEEDQNSNLVRKTTYDYQTTTGDVLNVTLSPAPGQSTCCSSSATWTYAYGGTFNRLSSASEPLSYAPTTYVYNDTVPSMTITDPLGRVTTITDNTQGQPISIQDPAGNSPTSIHYNGAGDVVSTKDPAGNTTTYQPDADGRVTSVTSPLNETTQYAYDALDDVTDVIDPLGHHTNYTYDLVGETASITPPNGFTSGILNPAWTTTITRSPDLAKVTVTDPLHNSTVTDLDGQGRRTDYTDKRGIETTYAYDLFGRVKQVVFNSTSKSGYQKEAVSISDFDPLDRPGSIADSLSGTLSYAYDALDSILSEADSATSDSTAYSYDSNGRRTSMQAVMNHNTVTVKYGYDCADELIGMSNNGSAIPSCSPSNYVPNGSNTTQAGFYYDLDGMPQWTQVDGILTSFVRDADERIISESYSAPAVEYSYGNLTYGYDPDGNLTDKGGSLATINLPPSESASYDMNDQLTQWNSSSVQTDTADNITQDPATGLGYQWSARNQLNVITVTPPPPNTIKTNESYDAVGRRDIISGSSPDSLEFLHDGSAMAGWIDPYSGNSWNFFEVSGATLAGAYATSAGTTTWVPLIDANGSTIALINPASPSSPPATTYTYDPFGMPTLSGSANNYPFLYQGMEQENFDEPLYYSGDGQFYGPRIGRSLSLTGALDTSSPGGPGPERAHHGGHHGAGDGGGTAVNGHTNTAAAAADAGDDAEGYNIQSDSSNSSLPLLARIFVDIGNFFANLFGLGGGGQGLPPFYFVYQARLTRGGRHPQYSNIDGAAKQITLNQKSSAPVGKNGAPSNTPPLQEPTPAPPSACSQYDAECAQSASSDTYACKAGDCCRSFGDTTFADCTRGCLLNQERVCFGSPGASGCRALAHAKCYASCAQSLSDLTQWLNFPACRNLAPELVP